MPNRTRQRSGFWLFVGALALLLAALIWYMIVLFLVFAWLLIWACAYLVVAIAMPFRGASSFRSAAQSRFGMTPFERTGPLWVRLLTFNRRGGPIAPRSTFAEAANPPVRSWVWAAGIAAFLVVGAVTGGTSVQPSTPTTEALAPNLITEAPRSSQKPSSGISQQICFPDIEPCPNGIYGSPSFGRPSSPPGTTAPPTHSPTPSKKSPTRPPTKPPTTPPHTSPPPKYPPVNGNPWDFNFVCCHLIYQSSTPPNFCDYLTCEGEFFTEPGYIVECWDGDYGHAGGIQGSCSHHGGNRRAMLMP